MNSQSRVDWIKMFQTLKCKTRQAEKDQRETRDVLSTQSPVLVMVVTEQSAPSVGHCLNCVYVGSGWLHLRAGTLRSDVQRDLQPQQQSSLYLCSPLYSNMTETEWEGASPSWLTLLSHATV